MRITKVYTRTGDKGETSLVGGKRVAKDSTRVEAYGDVDELNSLLGFARTLLTDKEVDAILSRIQNELFIVGADLASPLELKAPRIEQESIARLEQTIDKFNREVPPLREFILPGGKSEGAALHLARTVARRAERKVIRLGKEEPINPYVIVYLNRLSDLLFVLARITNRRTGTPEQEVTFGPEKNSPKRKKPKVQDETS
jgi:cob(I)alamin adenosyltransferase